MFVEGQQAGEVNLGVQNVLHSGRDVVRVVVGVAMVVASVRVRVFIVAVGHGGRCV